MREVLWNAQRPVADPVCALRLHSSAASASSRRLISNGLLAIFLVAILSLCGCGLTINSLPLIVEPNSVSFGTVQVGATQTTTVTLMNPGLAAVAVDGMAIGDDAFTLPSTQMQTSVPAGASVTFQVAFTPAAAKSYSSQIAILSAGGRTNIPISGSGEMVHGPAPEPVAAIQVSAASLQFGSVTIGQQAQQSLTLTSTGTAPLSISALNVSGDFTVQSGALPLTLQPGQALQLPVNFAPKAAGLQNAQLVIASNAVTTPSVSVPMNGTGATPVTAPPPPPPPPPPPAPGPTPDPPPGPTPTPVLTVSSTSLDFGSVPVGSDAPSAVTLTSSGTAPVVLQAVSVSGEGFSAGQLSLPLSLAPGEQVTVPLSFAPTSAGSKQGTIALSDNATGSPSSIALTGLGEAALYPSLSINPGAVDFGNITVGSKAFKTITLVANGTGPVTVNAITVAGGSFSGAVQGLPRVLQPSQQMSLKVQFKPGAEGAATGTVSVLSNATASGKAVIQVHGNGIAPPAPSLAGSASSLSFGKVTVGSKAMKVVTVTSTGTAAATITGGTLMGSGYTATYAGVPVQGLSSPITLQPGQQVNFNVSFNPAKAGAVDGQLSLATDTGSPVNVSLSGMGTVNTSPALTLSATSLDFGSVQVNTQAVLQLTLTSSGTAPVTISSSTLAGQSFQIASIGYPAGVNGWPATLRPGQQITLTIAFDPKAVAASTGSLTVASDASGGTTSVSLAGTGEAAPVPNLTLSATSLSFGATQVGSKATRVVTLKSSGDAPLVISGIALTGTQFSDGSPSLPVTLQPNQQLTLSVTFEPTTSGADTETLTVTSNDPSGPATISLGGVGTAAPTPQLTVNPASLDFGSLPLHTNASRTVTLTSTGSAPVTVGAADLAGAGFTLAGTGLPVTLNPNQSVTLTVQFDPATAGEANGQLTITSDSTTGGMTHIALTGAGTVAAVPQLSASTTSLSFGNVTVNTAVTLPLTLTSTGTAPVTVTATTLTGAGFTVSGASFPVTLTPNQSLTLRVQFDPATAGAAAGQLTIASDAAGSPLQVQLSGTGTVAAVPQLSLSTASLTFGNVTVATSTTLPLTLTSTGTAPVTVTAATVSDADFSETGATLPLTLNPGQSATLQVTFAPMTPSSDAGQLTIVSNASPNGTSVVQLRGTGVAATSPQLSVSTASLAFGTIPVNTTATLPLTLTSSGTAAVTVNSAAVSGAGFSDAGASFPITLLPNQSVTLQVQFTPGAPGGMTGQVTIASNSSAGGTVVVQLSGAGAVPAAPQLSISAGSLSFGNVTVNSSATLPLTLTSSGNAPVTVNAAALSGAGFSETGAVFPLTLNPNQSVTLQVQFSPTTTGGATGQINISSNSTTGAMAAVQLSGNGTAAPSPKLLVSTTSLAFGSVAVNSTATLSLTLSSTGTSPVTVSAAALNGAGFSASGASFPVTLSPNQSVTLQVQFDPVSAGAASGQLTITSNSSTGGTVVVQLSGTGTAVPHEIDLSWQAPIDNSDPVAGYNIYRSLDGGASFARLNPSVEAQLDYVDNAVQSGSTYTYVVKSVDASGVESAASNQISLSVP